MPPSSRRRCCTSMKATVRALRFAVRSTPTNLQLGRRRLGRRRPDLKQGHENWGEHRAEAREHGQGQGWAPFARLWSTGHDPALARRHGRPRRSTPKEEDAWPSALAEPSEAVQGSARFVLPFRECSVELPASHGRRVTLSRRCSVWWASVKHCAGPTIFHGRRSRPTLLRRLHTDSRVRVRVSVGF